MIFTDTFQEPIASTDKPTGQRIDKGMRPR